MPNTPKPLTASANASSRLCANEASVANIRLTSVNARKSTVRHDLPPSVGLAAVGCTPPGFDSPVLIIDVLSFDGGPALLAALGTCPVVDKAVAQPVEFADLQAEQLRANPEYHRYFADNAFLVGAASELVPALVPAFTELPTAKTFTVLGDFTPGCPAARRTWPCRCRPTFTSPRT